MRQCLAILFAAGLFLSATSGDEPKVTPPKGLRVFTCGHSFHVFVPPMLTEIAKKAGIKDHVHVGTSPIGGSRVIQHWNVPEDKFKSKATLTEGKADVLTLSPIFLPDDGIEKFATLAVKGNPKVRVFVQENWLPYDRYDPKRGLVREKVDHNKPTVADLKKMHEPYFKSIDDHVRDLNKKLEKEAVFVAPIGQAVNALREKIIDGKAPGLKEQSDLFTDDIGHATLPLMTLSGYCYYALIYQRSPVGLPMPGVLARSKIDDVEKLNRLLQEIAWEAVTKHPLSGVKAK